MSRRDEDPPRRGLLDVTRDELLAAVERRTDLDCRLAGLLAEIERREIDTETDGPVAGRTWRPAGQA